MRIDPAGTRESLLRRPFNREGVHLPRVNVCDELCSSGTAHGVDFRLLPPFYPFKLSSRARRTATGDCQWLDEPSPDSLLSH